MMHVSHTLPKEKTSNNLWKKGVCHEALKTSTNKVEDAPSFAVFATFALSLSLSLSSFFRLPHVSFSARQTTIVTQLRLTFNLSPKWRVTFQVVSFFSLLLFLSRQHDSCSHMLLNVCLKVRKKGKTVDNGSEKETSHCLSLLIFVLGLFSEYAKFDLDGAHELESLSRVESSSLPTSMNLILSH